MIDSNTLYLILAMVFFILVTVVFVKRHQAKEEIRRKTGEVEDYTFRLNQKIEVLEKSIVDLKMEIDELDEEIEAYSMQEEL